MKKKTSQFIFKKGEEKNPENYGSYRLVSLTPEPRKTMQQSLPEVMSRHMNGKLTMNSHLGFTKCVVPDQHNCLLLKNDWLWGQGESRGLCLLSC